ncbi:MAG: M23 family peptidase, partial [Microbacteriaceae bacterium]|nr:M23 family peptidase [Microbacteriaceae bacterium]
TPWGAGHRGLDIRASSQDLFAPTSGVVSYSGFVVNRGVLTVLTDTGMLISFEPVVALVPSSTRVIQGELIGEIQEGHCETLCVHLGLRDRGDYRSARLELGIVQRSVLVPWEAQW